MPVRARGCPAEVITSPTVSTQPISFKHLTSPGGPASVEAGVVGEWRGNKACCGASRDALHLSLRSQAWRTATVRTLHPDSHTTDASRLGVGEAIDLLDDSPTLRLKHFDPASDDQLATRPDPAVTVPATKRFAAWSRRYLMLVACADALVGGVAAAIPASISNTLSEQDAVPLLFLVGLIVWPAAIAICRGYRRNRIGIGLDEPGAVIRAGMLVVVAGALPAGFMAVPTGAVDPTSDLTFTLYALLKLVATGTPLAVILSLLVRFFSRKGLRFLQSRGRSLRHVVVVGSFSAAQQLSERIQARAGRWHESDRCLPTLCRTANAGHRRGSRARQPEPGG